MQVGAELRECDPGRFLALLKVAEDICAIHREPLGSPIPAGYFMFQRKPVDELD